MSRVSYITSAHSQLGSWPKDTKQTDKTWEMFLNLTSVLKLKNFGCKIIMILIIIIIFLAVLYFLHSIKTTELSPV